VRSKKGVGQRLGLWTSACIADNVLKDRRYGFNLTERHQRRICSWQIEGKGIAEASIGGDTSRREGEEGVRSKRGGGTGKRAKKVGIRCGPGEGGIQRISFPPVAMGSTTI